MYDNEEKTSKFLDAINKAAEEHRRHVDEEVKNFSKAEMERAEKEIHDECHRHIDKRVAEIRAKAENQLSQYEGDKKEELILQRAALQKKIFDAAAEKIEAFTQTDAYAQALAAKAKKLGAYFSASDCLILVRESDLKYQDVLVKAFGRTCSVAADEEIVLGGIKVQSLEHKLLIDDTYDSRILEQELWFEKNSHLKIV